jgi:hypothetical protein
MKNKHYTLVGVMACMMGFILAFAPLPEQVLRMTIMRHEDGGIHVFDTVVEVNSGFTIEQFLQSKGFDPKEAEIIHTSKLPNRIATEVSGGQERNNKSMSVMVVENMENTNGEDHIVTITKIVESDGNVSLEKKVNGEIVDFDGDQIADFKELIQKANDISVESEDNKLLYEFKTINDDGDEDDELREKRLLNSVQSAKIKVNNDLAFDHSFISTGAIGDPVIIITPSNLTATKTIAIVTKEDKISEKSDDDPDSGVSSTREAQLILKDLSFFPNPSHGNLTLQFFLPQQGQTDIIVYDLTGKEVYTSRLGNFQGQFNEQLNLTNLEPGTYIMRISQNNASLAEKLIIK